MVNFPGMLCARNLAELALIGGLFVVSGVEDGPSVKVWFHRSRAVAWVLITLAALRWWPQSIAYVIIASGYANAVSDWSAAEAADDHRILDRLDELERLIRER